MAAFAAIKMSPILNCFNNADIDTSLNVVIPTGGVPGISHREISNIADQRESTSGVKRKKAYY